MIYKECVKAVKLKFHMFVYLPFLTSSRDFLGEKMGTK